MSSTSIQTDAATSVSLGPTDLNDYSSSFAAPTTVVPVKKLSKKRVALASGGALLALLLLALLVGGGYKAYQKRTTMTKPLPLPVTPERTGISGDNLSSLQSLLTEIEAQKSGLNPKKDKTALAQLQLASDALLHLQTVGDSDSAWFQNWTELARIVYHRAAVFQSSGKYGKKSTAEMYQQLLSMKSNADASFSALIERTRAKGEGANQDRAGADAAHLAQYNSWSQHNFSKLNAKIRKSKTVKKSPEPEGVPKSKKNKKLEKDIKLDKPNPYFIDACLMRLAKGVAEWPLK